MGGKLMLKSVLTTLLAIILFFCASFFEQRYLKKTFNEFYQIIEKTEIKLNGENPSNEDAEALEIFWFEKKRKLHAIIPHNDVKEIDLWVSECSAYTQKSMYDEAISKLQVLKTLAKQVPSALIFKFENIF